MAESASMEDDEEEAALKSSQESGTHELLARASGRCEAVTNVED